MSSKKIRMGLDGADLQLFILRNEQYQEVEIYRTPHYYGGESPTYTWSVRPRGDDYTKSMFVNGTATGFNSPEEAQEFASRVLEKMSEAKRLSEEEREARREVWKLISEYEIQRQKAAKSAAVEKSKRNW